jgi:UDP-N-acetylmuramoyl-L-alanyl-D-glutamate--2,6-diaminopimelate ligase
MLRTMVRNKCDIAIVETTSEGAVQYRHRFINYDMMLFTGLYPEHIESHGSFSNYKNAKRSIFTHLAHCARKTINGAYIRKSIIVNCDDEHAEDFMDFPVDHVIGFTAGHECPSRCSECVRYGDFHATAQGVHFTFNERSVQLHIMGNFNATNAAAVGCICQVVGMNDVQIVKGLESINGLPGRIERISEGQDFTVIVDYAFEPVAVTRLYETIAILQPHRIIHVLGATGGGRDVSRRAALGKIVGERSQYMIVTNEDPYDDDPLEIMNAVADGAKEHGKTIGTDLFVIEDRKQAIEKAILLADRGDVVLITGKGSEQAIVGKNGVMIPWDDRAVVRSLLQNL